MQETQVRRSIAAMAACALAIGLLLVAVLPFVAHAAQVPARLSPQVASSPSVKIAGVNVIGTTERALESGVEYAAGAGTVKYTFANDAIVLELSDATICERTGKGVMKWIDVEAASYPVTISLSGANVVELPADATSVSKWAIEIAHSPEAKIAGEGSLEVVGFRAGNEAILLDSGSTLTVGSSGEPTVTAVCSELTSASIVDVQAGTLRAGHVKTSTFKQSGGTVSIDASYDAALATSLKALTFSLTDGALGVVGPGALDASSFTVKGGALTAVNAPIVATTATVTDGIVTISGIAADACALDVAGSKADIDMSCMNVASGRLGLRDKNGFVYYAPTFHSSSLTLSAAMKAVKSMKLGSVSFNDETYHVTATEPYAVQRRSTSTLTTFSTGSYLTTLGAYACHNCKNLASATIGAAVKRIGANAFSGCSKLTTLTVNSTKLAKGGVKGALSGSSINTVKVPKKKLAAYKKIFTKANCGRKVKVKAA